MPSSTPFRLNTGKPVLTYEHANTEINHVLSSVAVGGLTGINIPVSALNSQAIIITPGSGNQTYILPTATQILNEFGVHNGVSRLTTGSMFNVAIVNRSTFPAYISANPTGGDGTAAVAYGQGFISGSGVLSTGTTVLAAHRTDIAVRFNTVSSSIAGATGVYSLFV